VVRRHLSAVRRLLAGRPHRETRKGPSMSKTPRIVQLAIAVLAGALLGGGGYAIAASSPTKTVHGCVVKSTHVLLVQKHCRRGQNALTWNQRGPAGAKGATGATGATGSQGVPGPPGQSAVSAWEVVDANGNLVGGTDLGITHLATGSYQMNKATTARVCAIQVTPDNNSNGVTVPPVIASVFNGFPVQGIFLTNTSGVGVDDGFSVSVQC
jgi:hypothetical protein